MRDAYALKFEMLERGVDLTPAARAALVELGTGGSLSSNDYASTSGIILELEDDVWVNAPLAENNPNFVGDTPYVLDHGDGFFVEGLGLASHAAIWRQPEYHGTANQFGDLNSLVVTHGDRARISPVRGCAMQCDFCDIPFEFPLERYQLKASEAMLVALEVALADRRQPARHVLISGGTPKPKDVGWLREVYSTILTALPTTPVDIMMVPVPGLFDLPRLAELGVHEFSINIELFNRDLARSYMRQKYNQGLEFYLDFIERATDVFGPGRSRSMLMVGLEPLEDTLAGVRAIAERGGTPVLSPFRPDPATPLRDLKPPSARVMREAYERATEILGDFEVALGPDCPPCTHNTLSFADASTGIEYVHERPHTLAG